MSAVLKFKPRYTGFETRQYVLRHEPALRAKLSRLLSDLGARIAQEVEREMAAEKVSLAPLLKAEWNEADHPRAPAGTSEGGQFVGEPEALTPKAKGVMAKYKDEQAWKEPIKEFMEAQGLTYADYERVNEVLYKHNVASGAQSDKELLELWNSNSSTGRALRALSQWNEWQVRYEEEKTKASGNRPSWAYARNTIAENPESRRLFTGSGVSPTVERFRQYMDETEKGTMIFYRKGDLDKAAISTSRSIRGAISGSSKIVPDRWFTMSEMHAHGYRLLAGSRGLIGVTSGQEQENIWLKVGASAAKKISLATLTKAQKTPLPAWLRRVLAKVKLDGFAVEVADAVEPEERDAYKSAGMFAHTVLSTQGAPVSRFDVIDERSVEFASKRAAWLVGKRVLPDGSYIDNPNAEYRITDMIRENLRDIIARSTEEGWSAQQTAKEIRNAEAFSDKRAKNIARTELAFAHEQGALDEWRASGVVVGKRSILADTHPAPDVCDEAADEGVIPLDALFESSGVQAPPHHPQCLCAMVPEVEVPIGKADWDESKHPREPAGSEKGGEFIDAGGASLSDTKGQSVFSGKIKDRQGEDDSELELKLARIAKEKLRRLGFHAGDVVYTIDAPLRRTEEGLDEIRHVMRAVDDFDIMDRVVNSQTRWGSSWAVATDEWEAAQRLGGNGNMGRETKEKLKQKGNPLSEKEVKGFEARREWMQQKFREKYGDEVEVYRGVKGAYAKKLTLAKDIDLPSYTLSSWSVNAYDAMQFAGKAGHVLKTTIKAEDVWLLPSNGVQSPIKVSDEHDEIVVLNREKTRRVKLR